MQQKLNQLELKKEDDGNSSKNEIESTNVYSAYPIVNNNQENAIHSPKKPHPLTVYIDDFNDGYLNPNGANDLKAHNHPERPSDYLNNIEEKTLNTEKRVLELEKQLKKMRKLLKEDSEKNMPRNDASEFVDKSSNNLELENAQKMSKLDIENGLGFVTQKVVSKNKKSNMKRVNETSKNTTQVLHQQTDFRQNRETQTKANSHQFVQEQSAIESPTSLTSSSSASLLLQLSPAPLIQADETHFMKRFNNRNNNANRSRSAEENLLSRSNSKNQSHYRLKLGDIPFVVGKV